MIRSITDARQIQTLQGLKSGLIDDTAQIDREWLISHAWTVVPVESAGFKLRDARLLSAAFRLVAPKEIFAVATEDLLEAESYFRVAPVMICLIEFSDRCGLFNFVLITADRSAAVLYTVDDYYLVAGPSQFVAAAVGGDIVGAWAKFEADAADPIFNGYLQKVADRYRPFSSAVV